MKNKKSKIVILLLLLLFTGLVGYGVYSYYWAKGTFTGTESITIASFNPQTHIENEDFLGNGGVIRLDCSVAQDYDSNHYEYEDTDNICHGSLDISNQGDTDITITISEPSANTKWHNGDPGKPEYMSPADNMTTSAHTPTFNWTTKTLAPGESESLDVEVYVDVNDGFDDSSAIEATSSISDADDSYHSYIQAYVSFKAKATQVHD